MSHDNEYLGFHKMGSEISVYLVWVALTAHVETCDPLGFLAFLWLTDDF